MKKKETNSKPVWTSSTNTCTNTCNCRISIDWKTTWKALCSLINLLGKLPPRGSFVSGGRLGALGTEATRQTKWAGLEEVTWRFRSRKLGGLHTQQWAPAPKGSSEGCWFVQLKETCSPTLPYIWQLPINNSALHRSLSCSCSTPVSAEEKYCFASSEQKQAPVLRSPAAAVIYYHWQFETIVPWAAAPCCSEGNALPESSIWSCHAKSWFWKTAIKGDQE